MRSFIFFLLVQAFLFSCSSSSLTIETQPEGAQVYTSNGEVLGTTPFKLSGENFEKTKAASPYLQLKLHKEGFQEENLFIDSKFLQNVNFVLLPTDDKTFDKDIVSKYAIPLDELVKKFLWVQGSIASKKIEVAQSEIQNLLKKYPRLSAVHALDGDIKLAAGLKEQAIASYRTAYRLNSQDQKIRSILEKLGVKL